MPMANVVVKPGSVSAAVPRSRNCLPRWAAACAAARGSAWSARASTWNVLMMVVRVRPAVSRSAWVTPPRAAST